MNSSRTNFEQEIVGELDVSHKRWRKLLGRLEEVRTYPRLPLGHRKEWGQPRTGCPSGLSPELAEVNGKEMAQSS